MAPRKAHEKSRHGCLQCKQRRVKCNEGRPSCQNCIRRMTPCSFQGAVSAFSGNTTPDSSQPTRRNIPAQQDPNRVQDRHHGCRQTWRGELHLMHHYSTETYKTMAATPEHLRIWQVEVPREATKHDFLMDGIFSLTAYHCAYLDPSTDRNYMVAAMRYQNSGLRGYREALGRFSNNNCQAIFAFSVLLTVQGFAKSQISPGIPPVSPAESLSEIFGLLKGVKLTTDGYPDSILGGVFAPLFRTPERVSSPTSTSLSGGTAAVMTRLRTRTAFMAKYVDAEAREVYLTSIDSLEEAFQKANTAQSFNFIIAWPVMVSPRMMDLFNRGDPMALLIWLHYGVLTLSLHGQWWARDFGVSLVGDISRRLQEIDQEWNSWTEWARERASLLPEQPSFA